MPVKMACAAEPVMIKSPALLARNRLKMKKEIHPEYTDAEKNITLRINMQAKKLNARNAAK